MLYNITSKTCRYSVPFLHHVEHIFLSKYMTSYIPNLDAVNSFNSSFLLFTQGEQMYIYDRGQTTLHNFSLR